MKFIVTLIAVFMVSSVAFAEKTYECPTLKFKPLWTPKSTTNKTYVPTLKNGGVIKTTMTDSVYGTCHQGFGYHTMSCKVGNRVIVKKRICGKNCKLEDNKLTCEAVRE